MINKNAKGTNAFIPRITLDTGQFYSVPFILYRTQLPIVSAFAIAINKLQGQTFEK